MSDDTEKPDLKARLGRKRLGRTPSAKNLEQEGASESYRGPAPSGEMPVSQPSAPGSFAPSAPQMQSQPGEVQFSEQPAMAAPGAPAELAAFDPNFGKKSKLVTIIVAVVVGLPAFGIGYCGGHRIEQNKLANMATKDAKTILADMQDVHKSYVGISQLFSSPPDKWAEWITKFPAQSIKTPDLMLMGKAKLNFIPRPTQRKQFMNDLLSYYSAILLLNQYYGEFVSFIDTQLKPLEALLKDVDAAEGKSLREKLKSFMMKTSKDRKSKFDNKKGAHFLVLMEGSVHKAVIVPFVPSAKACPEDPVNCPCNGKNCTPKCEKTCQDYLKVYKYMGKEYSFSPSKKDIEFKNTKVAIPLENIVKGGIDEVIKYEISFPVNYMVAIARQKFNNIHKLIKQIDAIGPKVFPVIEDASKRKQRGFF